MNPLVHVFGHVARELIKKGFQEYETNEGVYLFWKCPRCEQPRPFLLIESKTPFSESGLDLSKADTHTNLACPACGFELDIVAAEKPLLEEVRKLTLLLQAEELSIEEYVEKLSAMPAKFMKDLIALTQTWTCPQCGEENPVTFDSCWKCRSGGDVSELREDEDAKPYPGFPKGGNSWEM